MATETKSFLNKKTIRDCSPIWEHLKKHGHCKIAIDPAQRESIIKGVINKKDRDPVFKLEIAEKNQRASLRIRRDVRFVTFTLVLRDGTRLRSSVL